MANFAVMAAIALAVALPTRAADGRLSVEIQESSPAGGAVRSVDLYSRSYALVIGNDSYAGTGWPRLSNAISDAKAVAGALKAQGFEVSVRSDTSRAELVAALEDFVYGPGSDPLARIVIWYAGHGHTVSGEGYLVPIDAPEPAADALFRRNALSLRRFGEYMREIKSSHVLAVFDACFAGTVFETARSPLSAVVSRATLMPVRQFISAGEAEQQVSDDGTFRKLFVSALNGEEPRADSNGDGYLTGSELGLFLEQRVTSITEGRQTPRSGKLRGLGFDRGDLVFDVHRRPRPVATAGTVAPYAPQSSAPQPSSAQPGSGQSGTTADASPEEVAAAGAERARPARVGRIRPQPAPPSTAAEPTQSPPEPALRVAGRTVEPQGGANEKAAAAPAAACITVGGRLTKPLDIVEGTRLCARVGGDSAVVKRITSSAIVYTVNGGYEQTCKTTDFCGFQWREQLMFNVRVVPATRASGYAAQLLPYR